MPTTTKSHRSVRASARGGPTVINAYRAVADEKKRIGLRNTDAKHFQVMALSNGDFLLKPMVLVPRESISPRTMRMLDRAAANFAAGRVSGPVDLSAFGGD